MLHFIQWQLFISMTVFAYYKSINSQTSNFFKNITGKPIIFDFPYIFYFLLYSLSPLPSCSIPLYLFSPCIYIVLFSSLSISSPLLFFVFPPVFRIRIRIDQYIYVYIYIYIYIYLEDVLDPDPHVGCSFGTGSGTIGTYLI